MELELRVNSVAGAMRLWSTVAPDTVAALLASLPIEGELKQCLWSGEACFSHLEAAPIGTIDQIEAPAVTIYPGTIVVRPVQPPWPRAALLIGYGAAEHRWQDGPKPVTPVGEISSGRAALFEQMRAVATTGPVPLTLGTR
jgi:hypothetical protein